MLTTVKGIYENGKITLEEDPRLDARTEVIVIFLSDENDSTAPKKRVLGRLEGKIKIADDFDAPLSEDILSSFEGQLWGCS